MARCRSTQECFQGLREACGNAALAYRTVARWVKIMDGSPGDVSEEHVTLEKRKKGWRMSCDVGEATEGLENEL